MPNARDKKSRTTVSWPILASSASRSGAGVAAFQIAGKDGTGLLDEQTAPLRELVGVHLMVGGDLVNRPMALQGFDRHLGLESR